MPSGLRSTPILQRCHPALAWSLCNIFWSLHLSHHPALAWSLCNILWSLHLSRLEWVFSMWGTPIVSPCYHYSKTVSRDTPYLLQLELEPDTSRSFLPHVSCFSVQSTRVEYYENALGHSKRIRSLDSRTHNYILNGAQVFRYLLWDLTQRSKSYQVYPVVLTNLNLPH